MEVDKSERKRALAKARYEKYMSIPGNKEKRLSYYKEYYRNYIIKNRSKKEDMYMSSSGNRIRIARARKGISQDQLCELVGITRGTLSKLEQDKADPKLSLMKKIATALDSTVEFLFLNEAENEPIKFKGMNKSNKIYRSFMEDIISNLQDVEYMTTSLIGEIENILNI